MIEIGCSTLSFRHDSLDTALNEIASQGFRRIDLVMVPSYCPHFDVLNSTPAEQDALQERLAELGFVPSTLNTGDGRFGDPERRQLAVDHARACLPLAQKLGAYAITIQSGVETPPSEWLEVARGVATDMRGLAEEAESLGLDLTVELHKEALVATAQQALDLMELIDHPAAGIALDPSHVTHSGENPAEVARSLGPLVKHVHLRDAIGQNILVVPSDGEVDFRGFAQALNDIGYDRVAAIELEYAHALADTVRGDLTRARPVIEQAFA
jgi:sugar phosphate isomerase/epimerase